MHQERTTHPALIVGLLITAVFCSMIARTIFAPVMPELQAEMGFGLSLAGFFFLLISVGYGSAMMLSGFLSARIGHGRTIAASMFAVAAGLAAAATFRSTAAVAAGMFIIGAGAGTYPPSGLVLLNDSVSEKRRSTALALHEIGPNLAYLVAPLFVIAFGKMMGWRGMLWSLSVLIALFGVGFLRWGTAGKGSRRGIAPSLGSLGDVLRRPTALLGMLLLSGALGGLQGVYSILPAYLVTERNWMPDRINLILSMSRVSGIILLLFAGPIIARLGRRNTIAAVLLFSGTITAVMGFARGTVLSGLILVQPALLTLMFPPTLSAMAAIGEERTRNVTYAVIITVGVTVGSGLIPALLGIFGDLKLAWAGFLFLGAFMFCGVALLAACRDFGSDSPHEADGTAVNA